MVCFWMYIRHMERLAVSGNVQGYFSCPSGVCLVYNVDFSFLGLLIGVA